LLPSNTAYSVYTEGNTISCRELGHKQEAQTRSASIYADFRKWEHMGTHTLGAANGGNWEEGQISDALQFCLQLAVGSTVFIIKTFLELAVPFHYDRHFLRS
jgi:beta-mannanase